MGAAQTPSSASKKDMLARYHFMNVIFTTVLGPFLKVHHQNPELMPKTGAAILASNHITEFDPLLLVRATWRMGRGFHFMAKDTLLKAPVVGPLLKWQGTIAVERGNGQAAMDEAAEYLREGKIVNIYPEATLTRDPDLWPMTGKTGTVRLALELGVPVIPMAHWGIQHVFGRYGGFNGWPLRKHAYIRLGAPVDLSAFEGKPITAELLEEATDTVMLAVTRELEQLRDPKPSGEIWRDTKVPKDQLSHVEASYRGGR